MTKIKKCTCKHKFQDAAHGQGKRAHNMTAKGRFRCTVCSTERD